MKTVWIIRPAGFILAGFCFVTTIMIGKIGDNLVYLGEINVSTVGILALFMILACVGFFVNSVSRIEAA